MGYIRHNAIIATAWQAQAVSGLVEYARSIGAEALVGGEVTNGYATVCIPPDGSKEGWQTSAEGDERLSNIKLWMREHPDFYYEWCEISPAIEGWIDCWKRLAPDISTYHMGVLADRLSRDKPITQRLVEQAREEFEKTVSRILDIPEGEIKSAVLTTQISWEVEKIGMEEMAG